jgi:CRP-like cAMP-binding protein
MKRSVRVLLPMPDPTDKESLRSALREHPAFELASRDHLEAVLEGASLLVLGPRTQFIQHGAPPTSVDILVKGSVRVFHQSDTGQQATVKHLSAPCTLGEMQAMARLAFVENAETLTEAKLVRLSSERFREFLARDHRATLLLFEDVCARFCIAARNERAVLFEVPVRLASLLLSYADLFGKPSNDGTRIVYPLTQRSLSDGLGIAERSVRRVIGDWRDKGLLGAHKGWFVIRDVKALEDIAGSLRFNLNYRLGMRVPESKEGE